MKTSLDSILKFADLLTRLRKVERTILVRDSDRHENDEEHSYSLAMLGWYINESYKLNLNMEKVFMYALAHDIVEAYVGDVCFYERDKSKIELKDKNEKEALETIKLEFPEFPSLHEAIEGYQKRDNRESKFVYALDKVEPVIQIYLDRGRTWKEMGVELQNLITLKKEKVKFNREIEKIFDELVLRLKAEEKTFFNAK